MSAAWFAAACVLAGWACLSLVQEKHHRAVLATDLTPMRKRSFSAGGAAALVLGFALSVRAQGWEFGPVLWGVLLSLGALAWMLALALAPRRAPWLLLLAPLCAGISMLP